MSRPTTGFVMNKKLGRFVKRETREKVNYEAFATRTWQILLSFF